MYIYIIYIYGLANVVSFQESPSRPKRLAPSSVGHLESLGRPLRIILPWVTRVYTFVVLRTSLYLPGLAQQSEFFPPRHSYSLKLCRITGMVTMASQLVIIGAFTLELCVGFLKKVQVIVNHICLKGVGVEFGRLGTRTCKLFLLGCSFCCCCFLVRDFGRKKCCQFHATQKPTSKLNLRGSDLGLMRLYPTKISVKIHHKNPTPFIVSVVKLQIPKDLGPWKGLNLHSRGRVLKIASFEGPMILGFWNFHPETCGRPSPFGRCAYFSNKWVFQPPTGHHLLQPWSERPIWRDLLTMGFFSPLKPTAEVYLFNTN